jgi:hypothetical protein
MILSLASLSCLSCSLQGNSPSSLLLGDIFGKKLAWCGLEELLPVTSRPVTKLWASPWENYCWKSSSAGKYSVRELLCIYTLEELFPMSKRPVTRLWDSHSGESICWSSCSVRESLCK